MMTSSKFLKLFIISVMLFIAGCSKDKEVSIPLKETVTVDNKSPNNTFSTEEKPLRFAIASILSLKETQLTYYKLVNYLEKKLDRPIDIVQKQTYDEVKKMFEDGNVDVGLVCAYLSFLGEEDGVLNNVAIPVVNGSKKFTSYIIVKKDSDISSLEELKGHSFAFTDPLSYSGYLAAKHQIMEKGFAFNRFFSKTYYTYSHDNSIFSVANGLVDGAAVHSMVYDDLKEKNDPLVLNTKIVKEGMLVGNPPIVIQREVDSSLKEKITDILINMHQDEEGKEILMELNIDQFDYDDEVLYRPIKKILEDLE